MSIHALIQDLGPATEGIGFIIACFLAWGNFKRTTVSDLKQAVEISRELAKVAGDQVNTQKKQIAALKAAQDMQERRLLRLEIDNARKQRMLLARGQEIDMLENIVRVAVGGIGTEDARDKVEVLLSDLAKFRRRTQDQQDEWEQTQTAIHAYLTPDNSAPIDTDF